MRLDPKENLIVVLVEVAGRDKSRVLRMALDTGATYAMLPEDVAKVLGYDLQRPQKKVNLITASGTVQAPLIVLDRVKVLGKEARKVEAVVHDLPPPSTVDGLLGLSFLKHFDTDVHYKRQVLEIRD